jgi:hypothetical protein
MIYRDEVFYRVDKKVQPGDEFYQIILDSRPEHPPESPYRVATFHGKAGSPPQLPETEQFYARRDEAESGFTRNVATFIGEGLQPYSREIHGVHDF